MSKSKKVILFQGDSITDCSRNREVAVPNHGPGLASGYCGLIAARLLAERSHEGLQIFNRGISGNRVTDLFARWRSDALNLAPDLISILIGVNDTWHKFGSNTGTSLEIYEKIYRLLLETTRAELPKTGLVLCEPFALICETIKLEWLEEVKQRSAIVQKLASEFDAVFVPFQQLFDRLAAEGPAGYWLPDGVHPTPGGHYRMAEFWLKTVGQGPLGLA